jgi:hypothetical protein
MSVGAGHEQMGGQTPFGYQKGLPTPVGSTLIFSGSCQLGNSG